MKNLYLALAFCLYSFAAMAQNTIATDTKNAYNTIVAPLMGISDAKTVIEPDPDPEPPNSISTTSAEALATKVYPNPVTGSEFTIDASIFKSAVTIDFYNLSGLKVYQLVTQSGLIVVESNRFKSGIYMVYISNGTKKVVERFVVK